jgi:hypothetical protein
MMIQRCVFLVNFGIMNVKSASVISVNKVVLNGTPVFHGTRVPVKNLFDFLEAGRSICTTNWKLIIEC